MATDLNLAVKLSLQSKEFQDSLRASVRETQAFGVKVSESARTAAKSLENMSLSARLGMTQPKAAADALAKSVGSIGPQARQTTTALSGLAAAARSAMGLLGASIGAASFVRTLQQIQDTRTRLQALNATSGEYARTTAFLTELSAAHHKSQIALADSYSRLLTLEQSGLITRQQSEQMLTGLSNAQSATGASAAQLQQVIGFIAWVHAVINVCNPLGAGTRPFAFRLAKKKPQLAERVARQLGFLVPRGNQPLEKLA